MSLKIFHPFKLIFITFTFAIFFLFLLTNPALVNATVQGALKDCKISDSAPSPGETIELTITTSSAYMGNKLTGPVTVTNKGTGNTKTINLDEPVTPNTEQDVKVNLGTYNDPGVYRVAFNEFSMGGPSCTLESAFLINTGPLSFAIDPPSPITQEITTINSISIVGVTQGLIYEIELYGKWNDNLNHCTDTCNRKNEWYASSNTITARNICENGNADRDGIHDKVCDDPFKPGSYALKVKINGTGVGAFGFEVVDTSSPSSGKNPCPGGVCQTALGDISSDPGEFAGRILEIAIGLAGGIALILMVIGSIRVLTSSGDQQRLAGGRDMIVAAIAGLLFLIFSVLILRFLGLIIDIPFT